MDRWTTTNGKNARSTRMKQALFVFMFMLMVTSVYAEAVVREVPQNNIDNMPDYSLWYDPHYWTDTVDRRVSYKFITERPVTIKTYTINNEPATVSYNQTLFIVSLEGETCVTTGEIYKKLVPGKKYRLLVRDKSFMAAIPQRFIMKIFKDLGGIPYEYGGTGQ
jgi:hypothetical protein